MVDRLPKIKRTSPYAFRPIIIDQEVNTKRRVIRQLPVVNQTETLQKFFGSTVDQLFNPGKAKPINGYIGQQPVWHNPNQDYYLEEKDNQRAFYQLEPTMVSKTVEGDQKSLLFYTDLVNQLRFQGAIVDNHHRLFEQEYYTWCPAIDLDKILNFRQYYWLPTGPDVVILRGPKVVHVADGDTVLFDLPYLDDDRESDYYSVDLINDGSQIRVLVDDLEMEYSATVGGDDVYTYDPNTQQITITPTPAKDALVQIWVNSDLDRFVIGKKASTIDMNAIGGQSLSSNMRIEIASDVNPTYTGKCFIVENFGNSIILVEDEDPDEYLEPDYMIMARGCRDENSWSVGNRWFHRDVLSSEQRNDIDLKPAERPIVEFMRDLELFNYGTVRRLAVDFISDDIPDITTAINGRTEALQTVDGQVIDVDFVNDNGGSVRILFTGASNEAINNQVYLITIVTGVMKLSLETDGQDPTGIAAVGDVLLVKSGDVYGGNEMHWDGVAWVKSQVKLDTNQFPLFNLYDINGVALNDAGTYPGSTFTGNRLFSYQEDTTGSRISDLILGFSLNYDNTGQILFENYLATNTYSYKSDNVDTPIKGFYFHKITNSDPDLELLNNDWYKARTNSRQRMVDRFVATTPDRIFELSQVPAEKPEALSNPDALYNPDLSIVRSRTSANGVVVSKNLVLGTDYLLNGRRILLTELELGDVIEARSFNPTVPPEKHNGFYEIPANLQANPDNEMITILGKGDYYEHFASIIKGQSGFIGAEYDVNNWRDTVQARNLGSNIVQHSATLLKAMLLASVDSLDYMKAARFAEAEYVRFRAKFEQKITNFMTQGRFGNLDSPDSWINAALEEINRGKTSTFPFYHSGMAVTSLHTLPTFIPATPSYLGIYPVFPPEIISDTTLSTPANYILGHDGSMTLAYGDVRDSVILALENRIHASIVSTIREADRPVFDYIDWVGGQFRESDYTREEFKTLMQPAFERWAANNMVDYRSNDTFDADDAFTWNWSKTPDTINGDFLPGNWRAIYVKFFDTDRPHSHPWEMLGFSSKPTWWDSRYGTAPYTRDNFILWQDLKNGYIFAGERKGTNLKWARPELDTFIPVSETGTLLDPLSAGIAATRPTSATARADWKWGDIGPVEALWRRTSNFAFAVAQVEYLMKPAQFVDTAWDTENVTEIFEGKPAEQRVNKDSFDRSRNAEQYVHGETLSDGTIIKRIGIQQWISDLLISKNSSVTDNFGDFVRGLGSQLAYRVGGFTDFTTLNVVSDSFDRIPNEDISISLYRSPSVREEFYGAVVIEWTGDGYRVFGYDVLDPVFKTLPPDTFGPSSNLSVEGAVAKIPSWRSDIYYTVNTTVRYQDDYYRCLKTHTSSKSFESTYWIAVARPESASLSQVAWYATGHPAATLERISYGSHFNSLQEVINFLNGYGRFLESRGWIFDQSSADGLETKNWYNVAKTFLIWNEGEREPGNFVALSPSAFNIKFKADDGTIQPVETIVNGVYTILDRLGQPVQPKNTRVVRTDGEITITPHGLEAGLFGARLYVSDIEHVIVLNNKTIFNDIIYSPLLNIRQPRLRLQGFRSRDWRGRLDAPGFLVTGNTLTPNFERCADDFRRLFEVEGLENKDLQDRARANVGYQERDYLTNLMLTPTNQFEFYQGMIQQKGTPTVMRRLLRSNFIRNNKDLKFFEEWAFRVGDYGSSEVQPSLDLLLKQKDFANNPQLIEFASYNVSNIQSVKTTITTATELDDDACVILAADGDLTVTRILLSIDTAFDGSTPTLTVGDTDVDRLVLSTDLSEAVSYEFELNETFKDGDEIKVYLDGLSSAGSLEITIDYQYASSHFLNYVVDDQYDNVLSIIDLFSTQDGTFTQKDARWIGRPEAKDIVWPIKYYKQKERGFLPNAGYVNLKDVRWTAPTQTDFLNLFKKKLVEHPPKIITNTIEFAYNGISSSPDAIPAKDLVPNSPLGFYRLKNIKINVSEAFVENAATITVGTVSDPDAYAVIDTELSSLDEQILRPYIMIDNGEISNSAIYIYYNHLGLDPLGANIGKVKITVEVEHIIDSVLPGDRTWVYNTGIGDWATYKLSDSGANIEAIHAISHADQGAIIALDSPLANFNIKESDLIILDAIEGNDVILKDVYHPKLSNQARFVFDGETAKEAQIMEMFYDAGMVIDKLTFTVIKPFLGAELPATISVGTTIEPELFVPRYVSADDPGISFENEPASQPAFSYGQPIQIDIFDTAVNVPEGTYSVPIEVVRSGNVFLTPSSIAVTNAGTGYTSTPQVTVTGPEGVKAEAELSGGVTEIVVTDGGENYVTAPQVVVLGRRRGIGLGGLLGRRLRLRDRRVGSGLTATAIITDGKVTSITITTPGTGYVTPPRILLIGGGGRGAKAEAKVTYGVSAISITEAGRCNYSGTVPAIVTITGGDGTGATATLTTSPAAMPQSTVRWRYRRIDNNPEALWTIPTNHTLLFKYVNGSTTHWLGTISLPINPDLVSEQVFEVELFEPQNAIIGTSKSTIRVYNTLPGSTSVDLSTAGTTVISGGAAPGNTGLYSFLEANDNVGLATVVVDYHYTEGFELTDVDGKVVANDRDGVGGDVLAWDSTRFKNLTARHNASPVVGWANGDIVEVDNVLESGDPIWWTYQYDGSQWQAIRKLNHKVDSKQLVSAAIYNRLTNTVEQTLQLYDPYKGFIPGVADREIFYKLSYDPATYTISDRDGLNVDQLTAWGHAQVGRLWWDLSTVRYLDYETDDIEYRWKNWGRLAPGVSVDVYEWVRSPVPPIGWEAHVNTNATVANLVNKPTGIADPTGGWAEHSEWNHELQRSETFYYFWVKNSTSVPPQGGRELTATQVSNIISDPIGNDIPYFAVIQRDKIIIGGVKQFLNDEDTILQLKWRENEDEGEHHKQWMILREFDERNTIDLRLWKKMRDSLVGWDEYSEVKTITGIQLTTTFDSDSESVGITDGSELLPYGEIKIGNSWFAYEWKNGNNLYGMSNTTGLVFRPDDPIEQTKTIAKPKVVPDPTLTPDEALGNQLRPRQSWFAVDKSTGESRPNRLARQLLVDSINTIFQEQPYVDNWFNWDQVFEANEPVPSGQSYSYTAEDLTFRDALLADGQISLGQRVLVDAIPDSKGFWTIWRYQPNHPKCDYNGFVLERSQKWRMQEGELWEKVDWYAEGWNSSDYPNYRFPTRAARDAAGTLDITLLKGTLVQIDKQTDSDPRWSWSVFTDGGWKDVAIQKGTFKLKESFYDDEATLYGYDSFNINDIETRDGSWELQWLLSRLYDVLFTKIQINQVFFDMVKAAFALNNNLDWAFKTSFLYMGGYSEELRQSPIAFKDQIDNVVSYIEEVKPYHVKIRDYVRRLASGPDIANMAITDFDKPLYRDLLQGKDVYRTLKLESNVDLQVIRNQRPWMDWYNNYQNTELEEWNTSWNPVRRLKTQILFDRIASSTVSGWDPLEVPWDSPEDHYSGSVGRADSTELLMQANPNLDKVVKTIEERNLLVRNRQIQPGTIVTVTKDDAKWIWLDNTWTQIYAVSWDTDWSSSMIDRVNHYYEPLPGMKRKEIGELVPGVNFRGTTLEGSPFDYGMWDQFMWDFESGWANEWAAAVGIDVAIQDRAFPTTDREDDEMGEYSLPLSDANADGIVEVPVMMPGGILAVDAYDDGDIIVSGNELNQPHWDEDHPDELVKLRSRSPLAITVYQTDEDRSKPTAFKLFKNGLEKWELVRLEEHDMVLAEDVLSAMAGEAQITIKCDSATFPWHDPENPSEDFLERIKLAVVDMGLSQDDIDALMGRQYPGVVWIKNERVTYWSIEALGANGDGDYEYILKGIQRGSGSTSRGATLKTVDTLLEGDGVETEFTFDTPDGWVNNLSDVRVSVMQYDEDDNPWYWRRLTHGAEYTIQDDVVTFVDAPAERDSVDGYRDGNILIQVKEQDWNTVGVKTHLAETPVYDGSVMNWLPMNYQRMTRFPTEMLRTDYEAMLVQWMTFLEDSSKPGPVK